MAGSESQKSGSERSLSHDECREITDFLIDTIESWPGETPFRKGPVSNWRELPHRPDLKDRKIFPGRRLKIADKKGKEFAGAVSTRVEKLKKNDISMGPELRLITLRLGDQPPKFEELKSHISRLSSTLTSVSSDIQKPRKSGRINRAVPLLSGLHVRLSDDYSDRFDPHIHAIWEIPAGEVEHVQQYLERHFGDVWIDNEVVRKPKKAAFYIVSGLLSYRLLPTWPVEALRIIWDLKWPHTLRTAGWFRNPVDVDEDDAIGFVDLENASEASINEAGAARSRDVVSDGEELRKQPESGLNGATNIRSDWKRSLFPMISPVKSSQRQDFSKYTVRAISSEQIDLQAYPTLGETLACAILVIESEQRQYGRSYREVIEAYQFDGRQFDSARRRVESYFHLSLFHQGSGWIPTPEGLSWSQKIMQAFEPILTERQLGIERLRTSHQDTERLDDALKRS